MLHIVTDGAADMPPEWGEEYDIHTIPINIQFGDKTFLQFIDLDFDSFYEMVDETKTVPKPHSPLRISLLSTIKTLQKKAIRSCPYM